ncbi:hypothetical protein [Bacteroides fragilis]|uniref:hypothetical protein n=1 Tax=Bacteroides fragilis TaxID=817 RepID=UPI001C704476|nr:hypothetical protein [Bacteroides fragilis]MBW9280232.1 hypothetical protein [Bacteroides fragilis]
MGLSGVHLEEFTVENVDKVYQTVKASIQMQGLTWLVSGLAIILIITKIIQIYKKACDTETGRPDTKHFFEMISQYIFIICLIIGLPYIILLVETLLSSLQDDLLKGTGDDVGWLLQFLELYDDKNNQYIESPGLLDGIGAVIDYLFSVIIAPILYYLTAYLYAMFLCGRYLYLLMLEVVAPVAIILLLNEKTQQYFFTWVKHMMICYLMLPFFMLANLFAETITSTWVTGGIVIWMTLLTRFILKLYLFKTVTSKLNNLL